MMRMFKYPLHPTVQQAVELTRWLGVCCDLYNAALQERRDAWRIAGKSITRFDQQHELAELRKSDPAICRVPSEIERSALRRIDLAYQGFFRRCKTGQKPGHPRFRSRHHYDSFSFPFVSVDGNRIMISKLGRVRFHRYRPFEGVPKSVTICRDSTGKWSVSIACNVGPAPPKIPVRSAIGIDLGLTTFATLSDGFEVPNPRWLRRGIVVLARRQKTLSRHQRGSATRARARILVARAHARIANQRKDFGRKLACTLFQRYDLIAHEDLEIRRMVGGALAKSISDAGWGLFLRALHDKAEKAGRYAVAVDPRGTSQRCSGCSAIVKKTLDDRRHVCTCGVTLGRDHNAALNILALGRSAVEAEKFSARETEGQESRPLPNLAACQ